MRDPEGQALGVARLTRSAFRELNPEPCKYAGHVWVISAVAAPSIDHLPGDAILSRRHSNCSDVWAALGHRDGARASKAIWDLIHTPRLVPFVKTRLGAYLLAQEKFDALVADLDDKRFAVRDKAMKELLAEDKAALPQVHRALSGPVSLEKQRRLELIAKHLENQRFGATPGGACIGSHWHGGGASLAPLLTASQTGSTTSSQRRATKGNGFHSRKLGAAIGASGGGGEELRGAAATARN
jgi:hypothetical protein